MPTDPTPLQHRSCRHIGDPDDAFHGESTSQAEYAGSIPVIASNTASLGSAVPYRSRMARRATSDKLPRWRTSHRFS